MRAAARVHPRRTRAAIGFAQHQDVGETSEEGGRDIDSCAALEHRVPNAGDVGGFGDFLLRDRFSDATGETLKGAEGGGLRMDLLSRLTQERAQKSGSSEEFHCLDGSRCAKRPPARTRRNDNR